MMKHDQKEVQTLSIQTCTHHTEVHYQHIN